MNPDMSEAMRYALRSMSDRSLERLSYRSRVEAREAVQRSPWDLHEAAWWSGVHGYAQAERDRRQAPANASGS